MASATSLKGRIGNKNTYSVILRMSNDYYYEFVARYSSVSLSNSNECVRLIKLFKSNGNSGFTLDPAPVIAYPEAFL